MEPVIWALCQTMALASGRLFGDAPFHSFVDSVWTKSFYPCLFATSAHDVLVIAIYSEQNVMQSG